MNYGRRKRLTRRSKDPARELIEDPRFTQIVLGNAFG